MRPRVISYSEASDLYVVEIKRVAWRPDNISWQIYLRDSIRLHENFCSMLRRDFLSDYIVSDRLSLITMMHETMCSTLPKEISFTLIYPRKGVERAAAH